MVEWIDADMPWGKFITRKLNLAIPGTLFEVERETGEVRRYLIGDINHLFGRCNHCIESDRFKTVKRYARLPYPSEETDHD